MALSLQGTFVLQTQSSMALRKTVAIIGATTPAGRAVAERLAATCLLVLMDSDEPAVVAMAHQLRQLEAEPSIDVVACCKEASWEADAVVVTVPEEKVPVIAERIKAVTTCKPVVHFTTAGESALPQLLPHAHVVTILLDEPLATGTPLEAAFLQGQQGEALTFAQSLLTALGCSLKGEAPSL